MRSVKGASHLYNSSIYREPGRRFAASRIWGALPLSQRAHTGQQRNATPWLESGKNGGDAVQKRPTRQELSSDRNREGGFGWMAAQKDCQWTRRIRQSEGVGVCAPARLGRCVRAGSRRECHRLQGRAQKQRRDREPGAGLTRRSDAAQHHSQPLSSRAAEHHHAARRTQTKDSKERERKWQRTRWKTCAIICSRRSRG